MCGQSGKSLWYCQEGYEVYELEYPTKPSFISERRCEQNWLSNGPTSKLPHASTTELTGQDYVVGFGFRRLAPIFPVVRNSVQYCAIMLAECKLCYSFAFDPHTGKR